MADQNTQVADLEADLQRTREDLAETVDQLADKVTPKRSTLIGVGAGVAAAVVLIVVLRRRRAHRR